MHQRRSSGGCIPLWLCRAPTRRARSSPGFASALPDTASLPPEPSLCTLRTCSRSAAMPLVLGVLSRQLAENKKLSVLKHLTNPFPMGRRLSATWPSFVRPDTFWLRGRAHGATPNPRCGSVRAQIITACFFAAATPGHRRLRRAARRPCADQRPNPFVPKAVARMARMTRHAMRATHWHAGIIRQDT